MADTAAPDTGFVRPRHTVMVVADGLRAAPPATMGSFAWLAKRGPCGTMDVGSLPRRSAHLDDLLPHRWQPRP